VLGLLFAPRSGRETRDLLAERAEEYWGEAGELYNTGKERAVEMYSTGKEKVAVQSDQLRVKIDDARGRLQEQVAKSAEGAKAKVNDFVPVAEGAVDKAAEKTKGVVVTAGAKTADTLDAVAQKAKPAPSEQIEVEVIETPSVPEV
jgi:gas vesicle protein